MENSAKKLEVLIGDFLNYSINGEFFEQNFSKYYDFGDFESDSGFEYFKKIRELLEHFTSFGSDLEKYPKFYINENILREKILMLKSG